METQASANKWSPLLVNSEAERAKKAIAAISRDVADRPESSWKWGWEKEFPHSFGFGSAGIALFFSYLARASDDEGHLNTATRFLDRALRSVQNLNESPGFLSGHSGILWTFEHVNRHLYPEMFRRSLPVPSQQEIDDSVFEASRSEVAAGMMDGLSGICLYIAERTSGPAEQQLFEAIADRLDHLAVDEPPGTIWKISRRAEFEIRNIVPGFRPGDRVYITGAGYGITGIVGALVAGCAHGIADARVCRLVGKAVAWVLAQRQAGAIAFPPTVGVSVPHLSNGWLFGDPGIAMVLFNTGRILGRDDWQTMALDVARADARICLRQATPKEAQFNLCEGAAGRAHIFNRLFHASGDQLFAQVARQHYLHLLDCRCEGQGIGGFRFQEVDFSGLLTGAAGVGLALLAAVSNDEPLWDRAILASLPEVDYQSRALVPTKAFPGR